VRPRDPSDSWEELEAGLGLEAGRVVQVEDGRELVEATHHRVNILELVEDILPRVSTQAEEVSTQVEVSTLELEVLLPRVSILVVVEVLLPRVNTQEVEEEVPPQACLPPALGLAVSPSLTSPPHLRVPPGPDPATPRTADTGNIIPSDTTATAPWLRSRRGLTTTVSIPSGW